MSLFFAPLVAAIPAAAYAPALIVVGAMMVAPVVKIDFDDYTEPIPGLHRDFADELSPTISALGITAGLILYPVLKVAAGRYREIRAGLWILCILSVLFYVFYPYQ